MAVRDAAAEPGTYPLVIFSHHSGGHRRAATFLCTHLASHGYIVAGMDHSEVTAAELAPRADETREQTSARLDALIASRVPDVRFLLHRLLRDLGCGPELHVDRTRIGIAGHSFGGWTALAVPDIEPRISAVVALAPGGASKPRPGILPLTLAFAWGGRCVSSAGRDVRDL
jgi:predicted dienelactone hydrolase